MNVQLLLFAAAGIASFSLKAQTTEPLDTADRVVLSEVSLVASRPSARVPMPQLRLKPADLAKQNVGRDVPFLLQGMPSFTAASDAGNGFGYTYLRFRGMDQTRINVTVNNVALNDPESHGVFWVNTPDLGLNANSLVVQRGGGTSPLGSGAVGASLSLEVGVPDDTASQRLTATYGSFNSARLSYAFHSGLMGAKKRWSTTGRVTAMGSDGFVDRSGSRLQSYLFGAQYRLPEFTWRLLHFAGSERTHQAWWGIPEAKFRGDGQGVADYIVRNGVTGADSLNLLQSGTATYNYYRYANEIDQYTQRHYQSLMTWSLSPRWSFTQTLAVVTGRGYFEQYKDYMPFASLGLQTMVIEDVAIYGSEGVRRRWLDNGSFLASTSVQYRGEHLRFSAGMQDQIYDGLHYGTLPWLRFSPLGGLDGGMTVDGDSVPTFSAQDHRFYEGSSLKYDAAYFARAEWTKGAWTALADAQLRRINYASSGVDVDQNAYDFDVNYLFFNPKGGISYTAGGWTARGSAALAHREPIRSDFIDNAVPPRPERVTDVEVGLEKRSPRLWAEANLYLMEYRDQLVPTGALNDVGALIRTNVDRSHRRGLELSTVWTPSPKWLLGGNATLSRNRLASFEEVLFDYKDEVVVRTTYANTPIALSPEAMGNAWAEWNRKGLGFRATLHAVGRQYLDNTGALERSLDPYRTLDATLKWTRGPVQWRLDAINLLGRPYAPNGYTWGYLYDGVRTDENFVYPMAGTQVLLSLNLAL
ncbi:MAG: TonB-dependent receptor [Schleiferiaceae bacterium]